MAKQQADEMIEYSEDDDAAPVRVKMNDPAALEAAWRARVDADPVGHARARESWQESFHLFADSFLTSCAARYVHGTMETDDPAVADALLGEMRSRRMDKEADALEAILESADYRRPWMKGGK